MTILERKDILEKAVKESVEKVKSMGYTVLYAANYGSHNYNLDIYDNEYESDVDTKVIILPTLQELVANSKPVSTTIEISMGQCDIKDIRTYTETLLKANIQFLELFCAQAYWVNPKFQNEVQWFVEHLEELIAGSRGQLLKSIYGMCLEKQKALCHPYPTIKHKIDKYGYDGKQLHHIIRLANFISEYFYNNKSFRESIWYVDNSFNRALLMNIKKNNLPLQEALDQAEVYCNLVKRKVDLLLENQQDNSEIKIDFRRKTQDIIIDNIKNEILGGYNG